MVTIEVNVSEDMAELGKLSKETIRTGLKKTSQDLISNLMRNSPYKHGLLRQWAATSQSDEEIIIQSPADYAAAQNYGSTHFIAPKNVKALHWGGDPGFFSKGHEVTIPGKHFVEKSMEATQARISEFFTINGG